MHFSIYGALYSQNYSHHFRPVSRPSSGDSQVEEVQFGAEKRIYQSQGRTRERDSRAVA
jgi:hypothetical protein